MAGGHREDQLQLLPTPQCAFRSLQHWLVRRAYGGIWIMRWPWRRAPQRREESLRVSALECSRGGHSLDTTGAQNLADAAGVSDSNHSHASRAKNFAAGNVGGYDCRLAPSAPKCPRVGHKMDTIDGHNFHQWDRDRAVTTEQNWWAGTGLNRRHQDFQSCALPTELPAHQTREDNRRARRRPLPGRRIGGYSTDETTPSAPDFSK
jgi:hypothetical protein